jgi:putative FmdB family regulatory protein
MGAENERRSQSLFDIKMPVYDYWCNKCRTWFEVKRPMADSDKKLPCKHCKRKLIRIFIKPTRIKRYGN